METITRFARRFGLSRSTILCYERKGLLRPAGHRPGDYRRYSAKDAARLEEIRRLREAGVPLREIGHLLEGGGKSATRQVLRRRLADLNREIQALREQQRTVVRLLGEPALARSSRTMTAEKWVAILEAAGLDQAGRERWHREFERCAPEAHQDFLESLRFPPERVREIRERCR